MSAAAAAFAYDYASADCGGLRAAIWPAAEALLRRSGALWLAAERALVVADLHLEKGSAYAARGQMLPPYDTRETLRRLAAEVARAGAARHRLPAATPSTTARAEERLAADDAERLRDAGARPHAGLGGRQPRRRRAARACRARPPTSCALGGLILRHEPHAGPQPGEVAGHLHPCAKVSGRGGSVRRRCFVTDGERLILPAFGAYAGGLNVRDAAFAGLFARAPMVGALGRTACTPWAGARWRTGAQTSQAGPDSRGDQTRAAVRLGRSAVATDAVWTGGRLFEERAP